MPSRDILTVPVHCSRAAAHLKQQQALMHTLKTGLLYFVLVFGAGFILGPIRIFWAVPRVGERIAELMETPIMLVVVIASARWTVQRFRVPRRASKRLAMGFLALGLLLGMEFAVLWLRGLIAESVFRKPRPCCRNGVPRDAWSVRRDAASRGPNMIWFIDFALVPFGSRSRTHYLGMKRFRRPLTCPSRPLSLRALSPPKGARARIKVDSPS
jgi:hypothetical protein